MHDRDALTIDLICDRQIGSGVSVIHGLFQVLLCSAEDVIWTSPPYISEQDAQTTAAYLANAIAYGECTECQGEPYLLSDIYPNGSEPELVWLCREHSDFEASLAEADR